MDVIKHIPFRMAALPDFMANEAMLAMTSGRASKIIRRTPIGQVTLSRSRSSSRRVLRVILPTEPYWVHGRPAPQKCETGTALSNWLHGLGGDCGADLPLDLLYGLLSFCHLLGYGKSAHQDPRDLEHREFPGACLPTSPSDSGPISSAHSD